MSMVEQNHGLEPNRQDIAQHLRLLFGSAREYDDGLIEIAVNTGHGWQGQLFSIDQLDDATAFAAKRNAEGCNIYVGVALRDPDSPMFGRCSDSDHYATTVVGGDLDTAEASAAAPARTRHLPPSFIVCTGNHPHTRLQPFWILNEAITDAEQHRAIFGGIADTLEGDRAVTNPSRVMRLAGSIAWPTKPGRVPELTFLGPLKSTPRIYTAEQVARAYPVSDKVHAIATHKNEPIERVGAGALGLGGEVITDGREAYMRDTVLAVLIQYIGENGTVPSEQELFDAAWPQYAAKVDFSRPGRGQAEMARKIASTLRRFERGQLRGLPDMDAVVARYKAKRKGEEGRAKQGATKTMHSPIDSEAQKPRAKIRTTTFIDLISDPTPDEPDYIEPNFLGPGNFCLIAGPPKAQKSFLLSEMLVACATGTSFLGGRYTVPRPLKVFYLQAEMNRKLLRKRARMMGIIMGEERKLLGENLVVTERFHMLLDEKGVEIAAETIREVFPDGPDIIAIDPLANLFDGESEDKAPEMMAFLNGRIDALRRLVNPNAAIIMVHHSAKKSSEDMNRDPFVAIRGSGALRGYYDTGVIIYRKSEEAPDRRIFVECRNGESPEPITVRLQQDGRFEVVDTSMQGISRGMADVVLDEIRDAWKSGKPLSIAPQTRKEGRHVGRCMAMRHGLEANAVEQLVEQWLMNGVCAIEVVDKHTKVKGLKVIGTINAEV